MEMIARGEWNDLNAHWWNSFESNQSAREKILEYSKEWTDMGCELFLIEKYYG